MELVEKSKEVLGTALAVVIAILWGFGGVIGAIIEAVNNDLLGVVLAIFIPGYGTVITIITLFRFLFG